MFLKTVAFIIILYLLVKFISRLFLPSAQKKSGNARIFYQVFKNVREQQKKQQQSRQNRSDSKNRFDEIEEAEYEEIDEKKTGPSEQQ